MLKPKSELMKRLREQRKVEGWIEVRNLWVHSQEKAEQLKRQYPPPKLESK